MTAPTSRDLVQRLSRRLVIALGAGAIVVTASASSLHTDDDLRTIASTGESSSECIGDPRTPLCALDTWEACFAWGESSLCEKVGLVGKVFGKSESENTRRVSTYQPYKVLEIERRHLADIENRLVGLSPDQTWFRPGYVDIRYAFCDYEDRDKCVARGGGVAIILKPVGDHWHVSGWHYADGLDCEYRGLPDGYSAAFGECNLMIPWRDFTDYEISLGAAERRQWQRTLGD